jgi:hypothetical protein
MTREEHKARAMLLGWKHIAHHHYYVDFNNHYPASYLGLRYDEDTLELLSEEEFKARMEPEFRDEFNDNTRRQSQSTGQEDTVTVR